LPELSHNVYDRSYSLAGAAIVSVEWDMTLGMQDTGLDVNMAYITVFSVEWDAWWMAWRW
jgi:hypothetical protein